MGYVQCCNVAFGADVLRPLTNGELRGALYFAKLNAGRQRLAIGGLGISSDYKLAIRVDGLAEQ